MNIYAKSNAEGGTIVKVTDYEREKDGFGAGEPPAGTFDPTNTVEIDFSTNNIVNQELRINEDPLFTVESGVLLKDGVPVTIEPDGPELEYFRKTQDFVDMVVGGGQPSVVEIREQIALLLMDVKNARDF